ncbi:MAG: sigma 54 modulation/S30EA ribosomal C-terminal domain-containing protein [Candidatus Cloacimonetes bacterium]|nr:sigma 54 modulation/S30EA ribosomal C-terminal domain-containing protein [Candidatus Cloacimonadota bacterium]
MKTKRVITEPMEIQEAMDKMEASKEDFFIFRNIETDRINVLVKRDSENYKLFEP